ncbi:PmoA family protein [Actinophytocola oryzae]|uniref:Methane monooxygenase PmoA-like n=1 Tax=Actinophytocola oryzae TaxID=502181 RepID=A0A4R7VNX4_9PSEU|nr:PmoA family protein [Actinophytocola oryzae]TDV51065.1 methane monooxygenase PmoA-like [Actinophytocola oryzae]
MELTDSGSAVTAVHDGVELFRYVYLPPEPAVESPRPYFHPVRTLSGDEVTIYRPHDHVWHKGIAWSLPNVGPQNFWGGPTFVRDTGYRQLDNNGAMVNRSLALSADTITQELDWLTSDGSLWFRERRTVRLSIVDKAWSLVFRTAMANVSGDEIRIGSPTTEGRPNAGYGGLMWRGPRSFTDGQVLTPTATGGDELMGTRATWLGFRGRHDGSGHTSTLVFVDAPTNTGHPVEWFVRSTPFACVCPAPFFGAEVPVAAGETLTLTYGVVVADGEQDPETLASLVVFE